MNIATLHRTPRLATMSFAELVCAYAEAETQRAEAENIMRACNFDDPVEEARFSVNDDRMFEISAAARARLQSVIGAVALDQILRII